jgi:Asp/Glu/hydantoin racemase
MARVLLLNPNTTEAHTATMLAAARAVAPPGLEIVGATVGAGVPIIADAAGFAAAERAVAAFLAGPLDGVDGVVISAFADPGLDAARARLAVPVVGIAEAAVAATAPAPFAIATTLPDLHPVLRARVAAYGAAERLVAVRATAGDGDALMRDLDALTDALEAVVADCIAAGAARVVIGGGPLAAAASRLQTRTAVPVVAPIPAAVAEIRRRIG